MTHNHHDITFMQQALALAEHGRLTASPNPLVGCVIVHDNEVVGAGYHQRAGGAHAEINALRVAGDKARGAQVYVNLEPCCHHGKTPPCTSALISAGVKSVYIATADPNPLVAGKGIQELTAAGIEVTIGLCADAANKLNEIFFHYQRYKRPFVIAKWAMSLDGKTVTNSADSQISSLPSLQQVHRIRSSVDAIVIGAETARQDNPLLTTRLVDTDHKHPQRIVISRSGDLPLDLRIFDLTLPSKTIVVTTAANNKLHLFAQHGIESLIIAEDSAGQVDLEQLLLAFAEKGITSILVEGGMNLLQQFYNKNYVDKTEVYLAPCIIGNQKQPIQLQNLQTTVSGNDFYISSYKE